jgi:hypothetical protein
MNEIAIKSAFCDAIRLWRDYLSATYLLHVEIVTAFDDASRPQLERKSLELDHYVYGQSIDWDQSTRWHSQNTFHRNASLDNAIEHIEVSSLVANAAGYQRLELQLISNDLNYALKHSSSLNTVSFDLWSSVFGKGRYYDYLTAEIVDGGMWLVKAPSNRFRRSSVYDGFCGSFTECAERLFVTENELPHPYQEMIDRYPSEYENAVSRAKSFI